MSAKQLDLLEEKEKTAAVSSKQRGRGGGGGSGKGGDDGNGEGPVEPADASLVDEAQRRYLNYAVSVITSRALPDVRDGLKPVQRRILYAMHNDLHLYPDARFRKSATIVGAVIGRYHPHGDSACYEAMVRMAQDFSVRYRLVDGHGNFGSLDGDGPAAYRYTEARMAPLAMELLEEIKEGTVEFRPNFDGTVEEPIVLPARVPQLLANGCSGIAVGMATNIPPHNLNELCHAAIALIDHPKLECKDLLKYIKGPDFPTGGLCTNSKKELREMYETGQGPVHLRGEWKSEESKKGAPLIVLTSIPYNVSKADLVEKIAGVIIDKKLPMLVDVRDESTAEVRVVLELKQGADPALVMAYLYKHTPIELSFHVNMTCLVPTQNREVAGPMRLNLLSIMREFLDFREEVVTRRFENELAELRRRIHILEGFATIFDALDETIRIIRKSDGKADAAAKVSKRFGLDEDQTDAILELKLYKLARLEIQIIVEELGAKRTRAKEIEAILKDKRKLWKVIRGELGEIAEKFSDKRRTKVGGGGGDEVEFQAEDFILDEEVTVIVSRDGWLKRSREIKDISTTRVREGDAVLAALRGSTKEFMAIFSNFGSCYVMRINDVPASTGYGEPVQKLFNFRDGERVVAAYVVTGNGPSVLSEGGQIIGVTKHGFGFRLNPDPHREVSTRAGRRYAKLEEGDEVVNVLPFKPKQAICIVTAKARHLMCMADEAAELANPGKGVTMIKTEDDDAVLGFAMGDPYGDEILIAELDNGKKVSLGPGHDEITSRGGKGHVLSRKNKVVRALLPEAAQDSKLVN